MDEKELKTLRNLIEEVMYAHTKKEAEEHLKRLKFIFSGMKGTMDPYFWGKLGQAITAAKEASGNEKNKERLISFVEQYWSEFKTGIQQS